MTDQLIGDVSELWRVGTEELSVQWRIKDVLSLPAGSDAWYLSPDFRMGGDRWRLRLNPDWSGLGLGLVKYEGGPRQTFHVTVDVRGREMSREGEKEFWGHDEYFWNEFCSRNELVERLTSLMPDGFLNITCVIKRSGGDWFRRRASSEVAAPASGSQFSEKQGISNSVEKCLVGPGARGIVCGDCLGGLSAGGIGWDGRGCLRGLSAEGIDWVTGGCFGGLSDGAAFDNQGKLKNNKNSCVEDNDECKKKEKNAKKRKNTKKISLVPRHGGVIASLKTLLADGRRADFRLSSGGREWPVHRPILEGRSGYFRTLILESEGDGAPLDGDLAEGAVDAALLFLYVDEAGHLSPENVCGTYLAARRFHLEDLESMCIGYMRDRMCPELVCDALVIARTCGEADLKERALECYFRESSSVISTAGWTGLKENHPEIIRDLVVELVRRKERQSRKE